MKATTDTSVSLFTFKDHQVRVVTIDGSPWFVAKDVASVLAYKNIDTAMTHILGSLGPDEKMRAPKKPSLARQPLIVAESGLYKLVMRSNLPDARVFQDWVTREVLPAIRKDGMYVMGEEKVRTGEMDMEELTLRVMEYQKAKIERIEREKAALNAENTSMGEVLGSNMHTVMRFARTIPGVNSRKIKYDLERAGYLYSNKNGPYRVYRKHSKLFVEKINDQYGTLDIFATKEGKRAMLDLHRQKKLTRLK